MTTAAPTTPAVNARLWRDARRHWNAHASCDCGWRAPAVWWSPGEDPAVGEAEYAALDHRRTTGHRIEWPLVRESS